MGAIDIHTPGKDETNEINDTENSTLNMPQMQSAIESVRDASIDDFETSHSVQFESSLFHCIGPPPLERPEPSASLGTVDITSCRYLVA